MTKTNKKGLITVALCAVILAVGLLSAYIIRYEFWRIYGFFDGIGKGETGLVSELAMDEAETYRVNISEIRTADGVSFSNIMWLVNADHPLSEEDVPVVAAVDDKNSVSTYAFYDLQRLFSEVKSKFGKDLLLTSTYRTREYQAWVYENNPFAVPAGTSEHETGLAVDVKIEGYPQKRFINSNVGRWVAKNSYKFGFIIRYPMWGQKLTGVEYEPWHLRYVSEPHAEIIYRSKITLEEYSSLYDEGKFYAYGEYIISRQSGESGELVLPKTSNTVCVSPDNAGGYYIWAKR
ncbi:MAG: M15 family metallopeptidase [Eubacteriales bacterium]|nr:M15 family metallopeptidase [Eubacteriales bacterium]MDY5355402.1 M15 family metallopeptidase [Eubacteriales bacterium]